MHTEYSTARRPGWVQAQARVPVTRSTVLMIRLGERCGIPVYLDLVGYLRKLRITTSRIGLRASPRALMLRLATNVENEKPA